VILMISSSGILTRVERLSTTILVGEPFL